jgi:hypothetical protein
VFEVIEVLPPTRKTWLRRKYSVPVKVRAMASMTCQTLVRTFEGHGHYSVQTYQVDFAEGEVVTLFFRPSDSVAVGDRRSLYTLLGQGYVAPFFRLIANQG